MLRALMAPRRRRALLAFTHDLVMAAVSLLAALSLRLGADVERYLREPQTWLVVALFTAVCGGVFWFTGLYRGIWRYASTQDMFNIVRAVTVSLLIFLPLTFLATRLESLPRSVLVIDWLILVCLLAGPRMLYRVYRDRGFGHLLEAGAPFQVPVLLVGAGDAADLFIRDTTRDPDSPYRVVGILDEKNTRVGRNIRGVPVLGNLDDFDPTMASLGRRGKAPQRLILTRQMDAEHLRTLLDKVDQYGMVLSRLPRLTEFKLGAEDGPNKIELRPVSLEDLLQRPQASLDRASMRRLIEGRRVLVTGAGGSIGSELARQAAEFGAGRIVLLDHSEYLLYTIDLEIKETWPELDRRPVLADVRARKSVRRVFEQERPDVVLHAAAIKHVPLAEDNPSEAVLTNVLGTRHVADCCREFEATTMVQISTDKAINPTSVMGATKRLAECYVQACDVAERGSGAERGGGAGRGRGTRFVTVRFGNVLGSTGSVIPLFHRQIERGGPVTVTHPDMTRYFMTVREAVQLVLQASALGNEGAESQDVGKIYVLDMGEPVSIVELARQMIRLAGLKPGKDIAIEFTGTRPGEKLYEELFHSGEPTLETSHPSLRLAAARMANLELLRRGIEDLDRLAQHGTMTDLVQGLRQQVPEFSEHAVAPRTQVEATTSR